MDAIGGHHRLFVNSQRYYLKGDPTYDVGGLKQTVINTVDGAAFTKEEYVNCSVSGTLAFTLSLDLAALRETKKATVMLECPNGQTIVFPDASFVDDQSVSGGEGEVSFAFAGNGKAKIMMP